MIGKLLCWLGYHRWYEGTWKRYCTRQGCKKEENVVGRPVPFGEEDDEDGY